MAAPRRHLIDSEWAETLIGLRMKVPSNWWNGIRTRELHDGKIKSFDELQQKWMLELDSEPDNEYGMAYEAVHAFVDEGSSTYKDYHLPAEPTREEDDAEKRRNAHREAVVNNNLNLSPGLLSEAKAKATNHISQQPSNTKSLPLANDGRGDRGDRASGNRRSRDKHDDQGEEQDFVPMRDGGRDGGHRQSLSRPQTYPKAPVRPAVGKGVGGPSNGSTTAIGLGVTTAHSQTPLSPDAWRSHQSVATVCKNDGGNCQYDWCPGLLRQNKRKRSYPTRYRCSQCSISKGCPVYLCNTTKKKDDGTYWAVLCHMKYHEQQFGIGSQIDTEEAPADPSDGDESDSS